MRRLTVGLAFLALVVAACSPSEELAESILENQPGVESVEIDEEDGTIEIEIEDEDGDASASIGGGDVPDDFPIPLPAGGEVQAVFTQGDQVSVTLTYAEGDFAEIKSFFENWAQGLGDSDLTSFETSNPPSYSVASGDQSLNVSVTDVEGAGVQVTAFAG